VYKIRITGLDEKSYWGTKQAWVKGVNVMPKVGGSGKTWTSKKLVEKNLLQITSLHGYGADYSAKIVTFDLIERGNAI
jgi:hypothetical protein